MRTSFSVVLLLFLAGLSQSQKNRDCDPELLYDQMFVFVSDLVGPLDTIDVPMTKKIFNDVIPGCAAMMLSFFGLDLLPYLTGKGPAPCGITAFNVTTKIYRLYGVATPKYVNNFPLTNGLVFDDVLTVLVTETRALGGEWSQMMLSMGMSNVVTAGSYMPCGQYRIYQNNSNDEPNYLLTPPIAYFPPMPMMPMFATADMDFFNSDNMISCNLTSPVFGQGMAYGFSSTRLAADGTFSTNIRNILTFPSSIYDRTGKSKFTHCEPLPRNKLEEEVEVEFGSV